MRVLSLPILQRELGVGHGNNTYLVYESLLRAQVGAPTYDILLLLFDENGFPLNNDNTVSHM